MGIASPSLGDLATSIVPICFVEMNSSVFKATLWCRSLYELVRSIVPETDAMLQFFTDRSKGRKGRRKAGREEKMSFASV